MTDMVEVVIDSVRVSLMSSQRVVVLRQKDKQRYLPIWVGPFEADSITVALQEVEVSRPLTHDLLKNILSLLGGKVMRVEIAALKEDIYFGSLVVEANGKLEEVDRAGSDAIALAVRVHVPIMVSQEVMDTAGIVPEVNLQDSPDGELIELETPGSKPGPEEEKRLNVFEDFLKTLRPDQDPPEPPTSPTLPTPPAS